MAKLPEDVRERAMTIVRAVEDPTTIAVPQYPSIIDYETEDFPIDPDDPVVGVLYKPVEGLWLREENYEWAKTVLGFEGSKAEAANPTCTEVEPQRKRRGPLPKDETLLALGYALSLRNQDPKEWTQERASADAAERFGMSDSTILKRLKEYEKKHGSPAR